MQDSTHPAAVATLRPQWRRVLVVYGFDPKTGSYAAVKVSDVQTHLPGVPEPEDPSGTRGGIRGVVGEYSAASRRRLREALWSVQPALLPRRVGPQGAPGRPVRWAYPASFVTLTYPGTSGWRPDFADARVCKRHLRAWWERVRYRYPDGEPWALWVLEYQARGAVHFHLLVRWPPARKGDSWKARRAWVSQSWAEVVAGPGREPDPDHVKAGTRVDMLVTPAALAAYVEKAGSKHKPVPVQPAVSAGHELAKSIQKGRQAKADGVAVPDEAQGQGRWWGILERRRYTAARSVLARELPAPVAAQVWAAIVASWSAYADRRGFVFEHGAPAWIEGRHAVEALRMAGKTGQGLLFGFNGGGGPLLDADTGELIDLTAADYRGAAAA